MLKLIRETKANSINIGIEGDNETEINEKFYSFWNHGATDGEFYWMKDGAFGYFCTTEEKLRKSLVNSNLFKILNESPNKYKKDKKGAIVEARKLAEEEYSSIKEEVFAANSKNDIFVYSISSIFDSEEKPVDV